MNNDQTETLPINKKKSFISTGFSYMNPLPSKNLSVSKEDYKPLIVDIKTTNGNAVTPIISKENTNNAYTPIPTNESTPTSNPNNDTIIDINPQEQEEEDQENSCCAITKEVITHILAMLVSAGSMFPYFYGTQGHPVAEASSISSNFVINYFTGYESIRDMTSRDRQPEECACCKNTTTFFLSFLASLPFGFADFLLSKGVTIPVAAGTAVATVAGNTVLYIYSLGPVVKEDIPRAKNFTANMMRSLFCSGSDEEQALTRAIYLIQRSIINTIEESIKIIKQENINHAIRLPETDKAAQLTALTGHLPATSNKNSFWNKNPIGKVLSTGADYLVVKPLKLAAGSALVHGSVGYQCGTYVQFLELFSLKDSTQIIKGLVGAGAGTLLLPLYILGFKGGWNVIGEFSEFIKNLKDGKFIKPTIWKVGGLCLGPLLWVTLLGGAAFLAHDSADTSLRLYEQCPSRLLFEFYQYFIIGSTDFFNAFYTLAGFTAGMKGLMNIFGNEETRIHFQRLRIAEGLLKEFQLMDREKVTNFTQNILCQLDEPIQKALLFGYSSKTTDKIQAPRSGPINFNAQESYRYSYLEGDSDMTKEDNEVWEAFKQFRPSPV